MPNNLKKIIGLGSILSLGLMSFALSGAARADDSAASTTSAGEQVQIQNQNEDGQDRIKSNDDENENEDESDINDVNEHEHEEGDVNNEIRDQLDIEKELKLLNIRLTASSTYGDVIDYLKSLQAEIAKIKTNSTIDTSSSTLSAAEQSLLDKLLAKHNDNFKGLDAGIDELNSQIQALIDLLSPVSANKIAPELKWLLLSEAREFRNQVKDLANLESLDFQILSQETI